MTRLGLISDTHGSLPARALDVLDGVQRILHAGDVGTPGILDELGSVAPVTAVLGNTDRPADLPMLREEESLAVDGHDILLVHGHRFGSPTPRLLRAAYGGVDVIVYGHTHRALADGTGTPFVVNPGSAGAPRFGLPRTVAILTIAPGASPRCEHLRLD